MSQAKRLVSVGEIINTQGHRGELRVWPLTDFPDRFKKNMVLTLEFNKTERSVTVENVRPHKNFLVMKFKEITDMNGAETLIGGVLKVAEEELVELPEDTYYIFDIVGMEVLTEEGTRLGQIKDVIQTGSNDVYIVAGVEKDYMIPALKEIVIKLDKEQGQMVIRPLEGLLDL